MKPRPLPNSPQALVADFRSLLIFMTRLPLREPPGKVPDLPRALRMSALAGLFVGGLAGAIYWLAAWFGLSPWICGLLALLAGLVLTGALHEDGLADFADGLGASGSLERRRAIMRDSRIGTFGALALVFSVALRVAALAQIADPPAAFLALVAAHAGGRGMLPLVMTVLPPAAGGFAASLGRARGADSAVSLTLTLTVLWLVLGWGGGLLALGVLLAVTALLCALARRALGGFSGDVLGAVEQCGEIALLLCAAALR